MNCGYFSLQITSLTLSFFTSSLLTNSHVHVCFCLWHPLSLVSFLPECGWKSIYSSTHNLVVTMALKKVTSPPSAITNCSLNCGASWDPANLPHDGTCMVPVRFWASDHKFYDIMSAIATSRPGYGVSHIVFFSTIWSLQPLYPFFFDVCRVFEEVHTKVQFRTNSFCMLMDPLLLNTGTLELDFQNMGSWRNKPLPNHRILPLVLIVHVDIRTWTIFTSC